MKIRKERQPGYMRIVMVAISMLFAFNTPCAADSLDPSPTRDSGTQVALRTPPRDSSLDATRPTRPITPKTPIELEELLSKPRQDREEKIDIFSQAALESVALDQAGAEDTPPVPENEMDFSCDAVRGRVSVGVQEELTRFEELDALRESACIEIGERDPEADLNTSEKLARTYPPIEIELPGGIFTLLYEPYPTGPVALDPLGYPIRGNGL